MEATDFDGTLHIQEVSVSATEKFLNSKSASGVDGLLSGDAKIKNVRGQLGSSGSLRLENPRTQGIDVGYPIVLTYDLADDLPNNVVQIHKGNLKLGSAALTFSGMLNLKPTPAQMDMTLAAAGLQLGELLKLAKAFAGTEMSGGGL